MLTSGWLRAKAFSARLSTKQLLRFAKKNCITVGRPREDAAPTLSPWSVASLKSGKFCPRLIQVLPLASDCCGSLS